MSMSKFVLASATLAICASAFAQPDIGGTPLYTEEDYFASNDLWA